MRILLALVLQCNCKIQHPDTFSARGSKVLSFESVYSAYDSGFACAAGKRCGDENLDSGFPYELRPTGQASRNDTEVISIPTPFLPGAVRFCRLSRYIVRMTVDLHVPSAKGAGRQIWIPDSRTNFVLRDRQAGMTRQEEFRVRGNEGSRLRSNSKFFAVLQIF